MSNLKVKHEDLKTGDIITDNLINPSFFVLVSNIKTHVYARIETQLVTIWTANYNKSNIGIERSWDRQLPSHYVVDWQFIRNFNSKEIKAEIRKLYLNHELDIVNNTVYVCCEEEVP